ncbi:hypothetical protein IEQ34_010872 [Dendrobium chrysotoxum]|uniref:Uncharacterized protein n=1 Tax=Dendrobium chrysotoxum TaxID=161865 RepID=A0AAV7GWN8_DENCH|nr:hypothetical protein IEQ34_010872 [Dendrobium chrysotoxum]
MLQISVGVEQRAESFASTFIDSGFVEWAKLIKIDLAAPTSRYEIGSKYDVSRRRSRDETSRDRNKNNDKKFIIVIRGDLDR